MKIYTPVKGFNGKRASVEFKNGVGETNNPDLIAWFRANGYGLEEIAVEETPVEEPKITRRRGTKKDE